MAKRSGDPLVSILCITYNHKEFIGQALESILNQLTNFDFELLINDDASTDGTVEILREYQKRYPDKIKLTLQKKNQYSKGVRNMIIRFLLPRIRGKYIALCEGDDYWNDTSKLQKQVDFLEKYQDYALCFHPVQILDHDKQVIQGVFPDFDKNTSLSIKRLLEGNFIQTNSVMYRARRKYSDMNVNVMPGDWYLHLYHAQFGKIGFIDEQMATYRRHAGGIWWESDKNVDTIWVKHGHGHLELYQEMLKLFGEKSQYRQIIYQKIFHLFNRFSEIDNKKDTSLVDSALREFASLGSLYIRDLHTRITNDQTTLILLQKLLDEMNHKLDVRIREIDDIRSSRIWRLRTKFMKFIGKS